jgi:hypothetical protein
MENRKSLTSEEISKKFKNQFDFVNYAIRLAENMIQTGRGPRMITRTENPALQVLEEILAGKDKFEEIPVKPVETEGYYSTKTMKEVKIFEEEKENSLAGEE